MTPLRYFFTSPPLQSRRLAIHGIGIQEQMRPQIINRPAGTGDFLIMYFYDEVVIESKAGKRTHPPGILMIWRPEDGHFYGNTKTPFKHSWMHCDGQFIRRTAKAHRLPFNSAIALPDATIMEKYLFTIHEELSQFVKPSEKIVCNLIDNWMCEISRAVRGDSRKHAISREMLDLKTYIDAHYPLPLALNDLAHRVHLSVPHVCSQFRKNFGTSVMAYVIGQRLQQAAYLLRDRNLRVTDVAREVGYEDLFYFSKLFSGRYGVSPREFRKRAGSGLQ